MDQLVHIEIEYFAEKPHRVFKSPYYEWVWGLSYSPPSIVSYSINEMITHSGLRKLPQNLTNIVHKKISSWSHQQTTWWCSLDEFIQSQLDDVLRQWLMEWVLVVLPPLGKPENLRMIVWITEGHYE